MPELPPEILIKVIVAAVGAVVKVLAERFLGGD